MTNFEKIYHPPGTAPGTLVSHHGAIHEELNIHLIDYRTEEFVETDLSMAQECLPYLEIRLWRKIGARLSENLLHRTFRYL